MTSTTAPALLAKGKVIAVENGKVHFAPSETNYVMHLVTTAPYSGPTGQLIEARIKAKARKVYTVPSGGGFVQPLFGPPKIIQGRALQVDQNTVTIRAGVPIEVELPKTDDAVDLEEGPIAAGSLVNAVALPGAIFEFVRALSGQ